MDLSQCHRAWEKRNKGNTTVWLNCIVMSPLIRKRKNGTLLGKEQIWYTTQVQESFFLDVFSICIITVMGSFCQHNTNLDRLEKKSQLRKGLYHIGLWSCL